MPNDIGKDLGRAFADGYNRGVKDFAKYLIDKSKDGVISVMDIPDYVKEWCADNGKKEKE